MLKWKKCARNYLIHNCKLEDFNIPIITNPVHNVCLITFLDVLPSYRQSILQTAQFFFTFVDKDHRANQDKEIG